MPVQLSVEVRVLAFTLVVDTALLVDLSPQVLDETDVAINPGLVVFVHTALFFIETAEILFHCEQSVLQSAVVPLPLPQVSGLLHQLCNQSFLLGGRTATPAELLHAKLAVV